MKFKKQIVFLVLAGCVLTAGCGVKPEADSMETTETDVINETTESNQIAESNDMSKENDMPEKNNISETSKNNETATASNEEKTDQGNWSKYYGSFQVSKSIGTSEVYALSEEEIDNMIGTTLSYGENSMLINGYENSVSGYEEEIQKAEDFFGDFRISADVLGLGENNVSSVSALVQGDVFGSYFFVKDENTLVIYYYGVFFEADRQ